jgi:hypothetical protein
LPGLWLLAANVLEFGAPKLLLRVILELDIEKRSATAGAGSRGGLFDTQRLVLLDLLFDNISARFHAGRKGAELT